MVDDPVLVQSFTQYTVCFSNVIISGVFLALVVIDHNRATRSASLNEEPKENEERRTRTRSRSTRERTRIDYRVMHEGTDQQLTVGNTEFSAHVASDTHTKSDLQYTVLCTDDNWYRRGIKEAIAIHKIQPTLNQDEGRHHLSPIYQGFP